MFHHTENDFIMPVFCAVQHHGGQATLREILKYIEANFPLNDEDWIQTGEANFPRWHQIVRNLLKSHEHMLPKRLNLLTTTGRGDYKITEFAKNLDPSDLENILNDCSGKRKNKNKDRDYAVQHTASFTPEITIPEITIPEITIKEGFTQSVRTVKRSRSIKLRQEAIKYYTGTDGKIRCRCCGMSFEETYGQPGHNFIEIHHLKPIYEYDVYVESTLTEALKHVAPVCSNCHRMIHRRRPSFSIDEIRKMRKAMESLL